VKHMLYLTIGLTNEEKVMKPLLIVSLILVGASLLIASDSSSRPAISTALSGLESPDAHTRMKAASELEEMRKQTIERLMDLVKKPSKAEELSSTKEHCIELLGEYKATEAIDMLIGNIEYHVMIKIVETPVPASLYPCVHALARIGVPSLNAIVTRFENPCSEKEMKLFATVFRLVDGDELAILRAQLALKKAEGERKKQLGQLVELLKAKKWYF